MTEQEVLDEYVQMVLDIDHDNSALGNEPWRAGVIRSLVEIMAHSAGLDISLHTVAKLIGSRTDNLRGSLMENFREGIDFVEHPPIATGGRPRRHITMDLPTFKGLVQVGRGPKAKVVRGYFGLVEEMYRNGKMDAIVDRRGREDESVTAAKKGPAPGKGIWQLGHCVYVIRIVVNGAEKFKIGRSIDLNRRWAELYREIEGELEIVHQKMVQEHVFMEACIHRALKTNRLDYEVEMFKTSIQQVLTAISACEEASQLVDLRMREANVM